MAPLLHPWGQPSQSYWLTSGVLVELLDVKIVPGSHLTLKGSGSKRGLSVLDLVCNTITETALHKNVLSQ